MRNTRSEELERLDASILLTFFEISAQEVERLSGSIKPEDKEARIKAMRDRDAYKIEILKRLTERVD